MTERHVIGATADKSRPRIGAVFTDGAGCPVVVCALWAGGCVVEGAHPNTAFHLTWAQFPRLYRPTQRPLSDFGMGPLPGGQLRTGV